MALRGTHGLRLRRGDIALDCPHNLQIETASGCIARCGFCPHSSMSREPKGLMPEELFRRIIDECAEWPRPPSRVLPFGTNEPFMDPRMPDLMRYVNEKLPKSELTIFTIGALFTEKLLSRLEGIRNWNDCFISLHHSDPLAYQSETGLNHEKTLQSIDRFLRWNEATGTVGTVNLLRVTNGNQELDLKFDRFCKRRFPGYPVVTSFRWNWKGDIEGTLDVEDTLDHVCGRLFTLHVHSSGKTMRCCMDQKAEYGFGDLNEITGLTAYNSPEASFLRSHTKREGGHPCSSCSMLG